jgi:hypothetical protein
MVRVIKQRQCTALLDKEDVVNKGLQFQINTGNGSRSANRVKEGMKK